MAKAEPLREKLTTTMKRRLKSKLSDRAPRVPLYHYTDAFGLDGILRTGCVRATHFRHLNDHTELVEGEKLVAEVFSELATEPGLSKGQKYVRGAFATSCIEASVSRVVGDVFVASFSEADDDLGQWRAYGGRGGGYSIGIKFSMTKRDAVLPKLGMAMMFIQVLYDRKKARAMFKRELSAVCEFVEEQTATAADAEKREVYRTSMVLGLWHAARLSVRLKHQAFAAEREWRYIAMLEDDTPPNTLKTRPTARGIVPFVEIPIEPGEATPLVLEKLVVGPTQDPLAGVQATKLFLQTLNYDSATIERIVVPSKVPFRG